MVAFLLPEGREEDMVCSHRRLWAGAFAHRLGVTTQVDNKLDVVSTYPNVSQLLNIARETCRLEFGRIQGVSEQVRREFGVNLMTGKVDAVELAQKTMRAPTLDQMLKGYKEYRAKKLNSVGVDSVRVG